MLQPTRANTILYCRSWEATVGFYRGVLGLPVSFENEWFVEFHLGDSAYLSIADASRASIGAVEGQGITLAWQVGNLEDVYSQLQGAGVDVTPRKRRWGAWVFYCHDPEGHRLEFWSEAGPGQEAN